MVLWLGSALVASPGKRIDQKPKRGCKQPRHRSQSLTSPASSTHHPGFWFWVWRCRANPGPHL